MEIDKLKKINALANELKRHRFAATNDEAAKLAEEFYAGKKEMPEEPHAEKIEEKTDALAMERFELILQMQTKKFKQELEEQKALINEMKTMMHSLQAEMEKLKGKALSSPIQFEKKKDEPEVQASLSKPKKEEKKENPRSGDYTSDDVDIQKMFYFGKK